MEINENLAKLIFREFDDSIKGTDIYNHDGSMWLIFTEERKWVVEFTNQKTLWYNYKHFTDILVLFGMEVSDGAEYIKKWYEDKFIFKPKIVDDSIKDRIFFVEDAIQNGVKKTYKKKITRLNEVEDTIQNGVKNSQSFDGESLKLVEDAIQNGVKHTEDGEWLDGDERFEDIIKDGVKNAQFGYLRDPWVIKNIIQNGVKHIDYSILGSVYQKDHNVTTLDFTEKIKDTIENGVKEISSVDCEYPRATENVIKNGVKYMMSGSEFKNNQVEDIIKYSEKLKN